jgi:hypothetical protein
LCRSSLKERGRVNPVAGLVVAGFS